MNEWKCLLIWTWMRQGRLIYDLAVQSVKYSRKQIDKSTDLKLKLDEWQKYWLFPERCRRGRRISSLDRTLLPAQAPRLALQQSSPLLLQSKPPKITFHSAVTDCHFVSMTQIFFLGYNSPKSQYFDLTQNTLHIVKSLEKWKLVQLSLEFIQRKNLLDFINS